MLKKLFLICFSAVIMLSFTGCVGIFDTPVSLMQSPKGSGDLEVIEDILNEKHSGFEFSYPLRGNYRNAVIFKDFDNDGADEAIAFYQTNENKTITIHICTMDKKDGEWKIEYDSALSGIAVDRVEFSDICSDEVEEILVGCKLFNSNELELNVYKQDNKGLKLLSQERYTDYCVCDLGASKKPQIAIFKLGTTSQGYLENAKITNTSVAKLISFSYEEDSIPIALGSAGFDSNAISISKISVAPIAENQNGVFVDTVVGENAMITEIFYYNETIKSLFYDNQTHNTKITLRNSLTECRDINGDGNIEIPQTYLCNGYESETDYEKKEFFTEWYSVKNKAISDRADCGFLNTNDGYFLSLDASFLGKVTAKKDLDNRVRILCEWNYTESDFGSEILRIKVFLKSNFERDGADYKKIKSDSEYIYAAKINKETAEKYGISFESLKKQFRLV